MGCMHPHVTFVVVLAASKWLIGAEYCIQDGTSYSFYERVDGTMRYLEINHCPNHPHYHMNAFRAEQMRTKYTVPAIPRFEGDRTKDNEYTVEFMSVERPVGIMYNGARLYSQHCCKNVGPANDYSKTAAYNEGNQFDQCGGHASPSTSWEAVGATGQTPFEEYHFHVPPSCLLRQLGQQFGFPSPQIGWALDGFPIYGPRGPNGQFMQSCTVTRGTFGKDMCTDMCGGYYSDDGSIDNYTYRYYVQGTYSDGITCDIPGCPDGTQACVWETYTNQFSERYALDDHTEYELEEAKERCLEIGIQCRAVTCQAAGFGGKCTVRSSPKLQTSPSNEVTYVPPWECQLKGAQFYPNTMQCLRGCCPRGIQCESDIPACPESPSESMEGIIGLPSIPRINGMDMSGGLPRYTAGCRCGRMECQDTCDSVDWASPHCGDYRRLAHTSTWNNQCPGDPVDPVDALLAGEPSETASKITSASSSSSRRCCPEFGFVLRICPLLFLLSYVFCPLSGQRA